MNPVPRFEFRVSGFAAAVLIVFGTLNSELGTVFAAQLPSLFRGVVVADGPEGVRIVTVDESSQAAQADLRPEDILVQVDNTPVGTIDQFSAVSQSLRGRVVKANVVVLRNNQPHQVLLHLYSYPILRQWRLSFVPNDEFRFADSTAGVEYWSRMGRGFEEAGDADRALDAYLNALHYDPDRRELAVKVAQMFWRIGRQRLEQHKTAAALRAIDQGTMLLQRLFEQPLGDAQLQAIKTELEQTVRTMHGTH